MKQYIIFAITLIMGSIIISGCSSEQNNKNVPISLTDEEDAALVRLGVLPSKESADLPIEQLRAAIYRYEIDTGTLPKTLDSLFENDGNTEWSGPYIKSKDILKDKKGNLVQYKIERYGFSLRFPDPK